MYAITQELGEKDRLAIIPFSGYVHQPHVLPLTRMASGAVKDRAVTMCESLAAGGGTSIGEGLRHAKEMLRQRRFVNDVTCVAVIRYVGLVFGWVPLLALQGLRFLDAK